MTFEKLKNLWEAMVAARKEHARLAEHGRGSDCEAAGMNLYEANQAFSNALQLAPVAVKQQLDVHRMNVASRSN